MQLTHLVNLSFQQGVFASVPQYHESNPHTQKKNDDPSSTDNYRQVSGVLSEMF